MFKYFIILTIIFNLNLSATTMDEHIQNIYLKYSSLVNEEGKKMAEVSSKMINDLSIIMDKMNEKKFITVNGIDGKIVSGNEYFIIQEDVLNYNVNDNIPIFTKNNLGNIELPIDKYKMEDLLLLKYNQLTNMIIVLDYRGYGLYLSLGEEELTVNHIKDSLNQIIGK